ncbi:MAG: cytidine deaminase [Christensenellales bacterium]|jgi:cytidine deaminase
MKNDYGKLMKAALNARENSYAPYSGFAVGAALLCKDGSILTGCNIENAAFSPTVCAERVALFAAVSSGKREFAAIAVAGAPIEKTPEEACAPCGVCRQVLSEFCSQESFDVVLGHSAESFTVYKLGELLPLAFSGKLL